MMSKKQLTRTVTEAILYNLPLSAPKFRLITTEFKYWFRSQRRKLNRGMNLT